ncbi:P-loop containing nucleoside triphosphate hydrolase protein [Xylariaceae sp. FL1651]|nr:P-loop containing nucleoside triphosphate hydrolase protein [Xylariaceae sp. FL1651]
MTETTSISFGPENHGFQVGQNYGPIHLAPACPERPETPPKPSFNIPFRRDNDFVERKYLLDRIQRACSAPGSRAALVGLGGVGKSQLAIEHAYRVKDEFTRESKEIWVFWIHAETQARVEEGFKSIADTVKIPGRNQPTADIPQLVYQWLQNERNGRWLMVLDSADDINVFYETELQADRTATKSSKKPFSAYLPQTVAYRLTGSYDNIVKVGPMDQKDALTLLGKKLKESTDIIVTTKLVEALEYMPLAISQAAAYIQRRAPRSSVAKYLEEFQKSERKQSSLLNHDAGDLRRDGSAKNSIITTWQISFNHIRANRPSATNLLSLMSFFDRQGILESLELSDAFEEDIATLKDYCLIQTNAEGNVFEMHGLVQLATRRWLDATGEGKNFKSQYIGLMAQSFPTGHFENWSTWYRPDDKKSQIEWARLLYHGSWYAREQGRYTMSETMATMSRDMYETVLGPTHPDTLDSMEKLASIYWYQGQWNETEKTVLGPKHPDTLISMNNLAATYWNQGRWNEAEKTVLGPKHSDTVISMSNLASTYWNQGRWNEAELLNVQVLEISKTVLGPKHPDTLLSMNNLASTYWNQGRWNEAELLNVQVLEISKTVLGPKHPDTLLSMNNLASTYWNQGRMSNLASTYRNQGRWNEAESLDAQVLEISKTVLGPEHPSTLLSMSNLASTYWNQGRWNEAESLEAQVLEISKTVLGPEHPSTLISMNNLAYTWKTLGRNANAIRLMEDCIRIRYRVLRPDHPSTLSSLSTLSRWQKESGLV